jgi:septum formation protein
MPGPGETRASGGAGVTFPCDDGGDGGRPRLILGSASLRRRALLAQIGVVPDEIRAAEIDETPRKGELPRAYVERMAREKAAAICAALGTQGEVRPPFVLTADTEVSAGRRILGKPADPAEAVRFLLLLSGRRHRVKTAVCLRHGAREWLRLVETRVRFKRLSDTEISAYIRSGEWRGKAGGYAIQGLAGAFIPEINGSYTNVVGLPLTETAAMLQGAGYPVSFEEVAG